MKRNQIPSQKREKWYLMFWSIIFNSLARSFISCSSILCCVVVVDQMVVMREVNIDDEDDSYSENKEKFLKLYIL